MQGSPQWVISRVVLIPGYLVGIWSGWWVGCSVFSDSMFTLASLQFSEVCKSRTSLRCNECPQHMAYSSHLGNDSTKLRKFNFGVYSSNLGGLPSVQLVWQPSSWGLHSPLSWDPFASRVFSFLLSICFLFLGLFPHFGGVSSSSFLRMMHGK